MDEYLEPTLPTPVVVARPRARQRSSLTWSLPATTLVVLGLAALTVLAFAVDSLGHGALVVLAPLGDSAVVAPDPDRYAAVLVVAAVSSLLAALGGSVAWDRRSPGAPAAARGLVVAVAASALAVVVVVVGLGLA